MNNFQVEAANQSLTAKPLQIAGISKRLRFEHTSVEDFCQKPHNKSGTFLLPIGTFHCYQGDNFACQLSHEIYLLEFGKKCYSEARNAE